MLLQVTVASWNILCPELCNPENFRHTNHKDIESLIVTSSKALVSTSFLLLLVRHLLLLAMHLLLVACYLLFSAFFCEILILLLASRRPPASFSHLLLFLFDPQLLYTHKLHMQGSGPGIGMFEEVQRACNNDGGMLEYMV